MDFLLNVADVDLFTSQNSHITFMASIIEFAEKLDAALARHDLQAIKRIVGAYGDLLDDLRNALDALLLTIEKEQPTQAQLARMARYRSFMRQTNDELNKFQSWLEPELTRTARENLSLGVRDAERLVMNQLEEAGLTLPAGFNRLPARTIEKLLGFLDKQGPLYARLQKLAPTTADQISKALLRGVGFGYGSKKIERLFLRGLGMGLTDAVRMTRTVQMYSYREANRAEYLINPDTVTGWYWFAHLGWGVCVSCLAQHGTLHPSTETLNDHHNGRCSMVPAIVGVESPIAQSGEDWFGQQPKSEQIKMMGRYKFDAWQNGQFEFSQLTTETDDEVYGRMKGETPLWMLLGAEPPVRKQNL